MDPNVSLFGDPVALFDASGMLILDIPQKFKQAWWTRSRNLLVRRRRFLDLPFPSNLAMDWVASCGIFRSSTVSGCHFVHLISPAVIKW